MTADPRSPDYGANNRIFTRERAEAARKRLNELAASGRLDRLENYMLAGCDPEDDPAERRKRLRFVQWVHGLGPAPDA